MDTSFVATLSSNIDALGKSFTATTYGALATYLTPVLSGLLVLYLVFWGFQFWQGRGDRNVIAAAFRMLRLAVIFFIATSWGPFQIAIYNVATMAPLFISNNVMLNSVINPDNGKAMSVGTVAADISTIYAIAVKASMRIEREAPAVATAPSQKAADGENTSPAPVRARPPANIVDTLFSRRHYKERSYGFQRRCLWAMPCFSCFSPRWRSGSCLRWRQSSSFF
jgi:type IV secretion system protein VirB6